MHTGETELSDDASNSSITFLWHCRVLQFNYKLAKLLIHMYTWHGLYMNVRVLFYAPNSLIHSLVHVLIPWFSFLDKMYCMSSAEALVQFTRNPRSFLLPPNPRIPCKICVVGPTSGKSTLASLLAEKYNGVVSTTYMYMCSIIHFSVATFWNNH